MEFSISENANVGDIVTTLAASDEDDGHTPILSPSMYSTFNISSVGEISVNQRLIMKQNNQLILKYMLPILLMLLFKII